MDDKKTELVAPPFEYDRKKIQQSPEDKEFFQILAWPLDKLIKFIDRGGKK